MGAPAREFLHGDGRSGQTRSPSVSHTLTLVCAGGRAERDAQLAAAGGAGVLEVAQHLQVARQVAARLPRGRRRQREQPHRVL